MTDEPRHDYQTPPGYVREAGEVAHTGEPWEAHQEAGEEPVQPEASPPPVSRPRMWPRIVGVLLLFVIVGGVWIWQNPGFVQSHMPWLFAGSASRETAPSETNTLDARVARLEQDLPSGMATLTRRLDALEARPSQTTVPAASPDLRPLQNRLDAIEAKIASMAARPAATPPAPGTAQQIAGTSDIGSLAARLEALERLQAQQTADAAKIETLQAQVNALSAHNPAELSGQLDTVEHRLGEIAESETKLAGTSDRLSRLAQVNAAEIALAAGRPLGSIPDAPPALTRFATTAPPTEAGLRLAFAAASQQALQVSQPDTEGKPFFDRVLARLQDFRLITVREGDHVVIGNSTAATLARARVLLDVGDLNDAIKAVGTLSGPPAAKMAPWLADANALQAAREALASLAGRG